MRCRNRNLFKGYIVLFQASLECLIKLLINHLSFSFIMAHPLVDEFNDYRSKMNEKILGQKNLTINRFFNLDGHAYADGVLDARTKEMLGLVASMVLRCDDCIKYHLGKCHELGINTDEIFEVMAIANLVGGSICIPHTRRGVEYWEALQSEQK